MSIRARVCADALEAAGVDRVVTLDLHAPQVQGFFRVPVDDLRAAPVLTEAITSKGYDDLVVVAPDAGFAKKARDYATRLGVPLAIADKRRVDHSETAEITELMGDVAGRTALVVDDFTISAITLIDAARMLADRGATRVLAAVSQSLLADAAARRLAGSGIERLYVTDAVATSAAVAEAAADRLEMVSVAGLFGEAIRRIARRESISVLFE